MFRVALIGLVRGYQRFLSPLKPPTCRFDPTCSSYAITALRRFGSLRGSWLTVRRLVRCQPFCEPGYDPVPERTPRANPRAEE